jgi:[ribosomal protein S18]-alanine N-acetyltransferase
MLRRATRVDIEVMAEIHASAFPAADAWSGDVFDLQLALPNVFALLHEAGGLILVRIAADEADILTLAVAPDARKGGVGYILLMKATEMVANQGSRAVFLEVSVANIAALRLYTQAGFAEVGRRAGYYSDNSDALVLRLDLQNRRETAGVAR